MDEKYKRSYRWRLTAMIMLFLLVLAVIFIAIFALPNDEGQPTTETNKTISGSVNFTGATDNTFYIKDIGEVSSDDITLYFDIINATTQPFTVSASWTGDDDGTIYYLHETTVPAGTGEEITADTPATAILPLDVTFGSSASIDLSDITIDFAQLYSDFEFELNEDMTATLTAYNGAGGDVVIPETFSVIDNGDGTQSYVEGTQYTVTEIYDDPSSSTSVFYNRTDITSITFPENLTSIGFSAFYGCTGLTNIDLSRCTNLTSIRDGVFYECSGLISITLPESLISIGDFAFAYCTGLTSITLPETLTSIGSDAFLNCEGLTALDLSGCINLTSIEDWTFTSCIALTSITLPEHLKSIGQSVFFGCRSLYSVVFGDTTGWQVSTLSDFSRNVIDIEEAQLQDSSTVSELLTSTYVDYYWRKVEA